MLAKNNMSRTCPIYILKTRMVLIQKSISNIRLYDGISINKMSKIHNFNKGKYILLISNKEKYIQKNHFNCFLNIPLGGGTGVNNCI